VCEVDDGNSFLFWWDPWMEDVALKVMFSRIFELSGNKMATVAEMERLGWGENGETWKWCRPLWAWEEEQLRECSACLNFIILQDDVTGRWQWNVHITKSYTAINAYNFLQQTSSQHINEDDFHVFWHKDVPNLIFLCGISFSTVFQQTTIR